MIKIPSAKIGFMSARPAFSASLVFSHTYIVKLEGLYSYVSIILGKKVNKLKSLKVAK